MFNALRKLLGGAVGEVAKGAQGAARAMTSQPLPQGPSIRPGMDNRGPQEFGRYTQPFVPQDNQAQLDQFTKNNINTSIGGMMSGIGDNGGVSRDMGWSDQQLHNPWALPAQQVGPFLERQTKKAIKGSFRDY